MSTSPPCVALDSPIHATSPAPATSADVFFANGIVRQADSPLRFTTPSAFAPRTAKSVPASSIATFATSSFPSST